MKEIPISEEQALLLDVVKTVDEICRKEEIKYFIAHGTLLGAIREKGFIPWDDDIDILMFRDDYERFSEAFAAHNRNEELFLQNYVSDPWLLSPDMTRICINDTFKWPMDCLHEKFNTGIYVDIFPLDYGFGDKRDEKNLARVKKLRRFLYASHKGYGKGYKKARIMHFISSLIPRAFISNKILSIEAKHRYCNSDTVICFPAAHSSSIYPRDLFADNIDVDFEDLKLSAPSKYDEVLKCDYGSDYMIPKKIKHGRTVAYRL